MCHKLVKIINLKNYMNNKKFSKFFESIKNKLGIRKTSFTKIFQYLDNIKGLINIVETGCLRIKDNFSGDVKALCFLINILNLEEKSQKFTL